jgi:4-hydroxy-tetrahydrodipicolinate synthase
MKLFTGSGVAIVTPFTGTKVNYELFVKMIKWHIKQGTDAIIVTGTTGESPTLTDEEKLKLYQTAVKNGAGRIKIIANTGNYNTAESIKLSKLAKQAKVDGLLLVTPYYNKPTQRGLYAHFKAIADAVKPLPVILYNVPGRTSVNLEANTTLELAKIKNIIGIKEASGNLQQIKAIIKGNKNFQVFSGNDDQYLEVLKLGGDGVISVVANLAPRETHDLYATFQKNLITAEVMQRQLNILNNVLFIETNPVPTKTALNLLGVNVGAPRLPLVEMEPKNISKLKAALKAFRLKEIKL